jgi:TRAP-type mannitol/chloroaromatic compound transport system permease small subunit
MNAMLQFSRGVDWMNDRLGRGLIWLILAAVLISAGNAIVRKAFDMSSNALLEIQWYLFASCSCSVPALPSSRTPTSA